MTDEKLGTALGHAAWNAKCDRRKVVGERFDRAGWDMDFDVEPSDMRSTDRLAGSPPLTQAEVDAVMGVDAEPKPAGTRYTAPDRSQTYDQGTVRARAAIAELQGAPVFNLTTADAILLELKVITDRLTKIEEALASPVRGGEWAEVPYQRTVI